MEIRWKFNKRKRLAKQMEDIPLVANINTKDPFHPSTRQRLHLIDELRGLCIFCMVFYHTFYTMEHFFSIPMGGKLLRYFMPVEPLFAGLFILIAGISSHLSRSNIKRGLKLLGISLLLSLSTILLLPNAAIYFGVLHMLSISMLFFGFVSPILKKVSPIFGMLICTFCFPMTRTISKGFLTISGNLRIVLPDLWYHSPFLFPLGIYRDDFYSADYFPLFPWIFLYLFGTFLGVILTKEHRPECLAQLHSPFFSLLGRHALLIYLVHQPLIFFILWLIEHIA